MAPSKPQRDLNAAELFRQYGEFVARFLFRLGVPANAIDDTVQEVFLVAHQRGGYRSGPAKPSTYLGVIATHAAAAQRRRARTRAAREASSTPEELRSEAPSPEHSLQTRDQLRRLQAALDKLDPDLRATLLLADGEGETCVSIAEAMGTPVGTVYWRLHEARKRFRRALDLVDAAADRTAAATRRAATDSERIPAGTLARTLGVLIMAFGWLIPGWRGSKAQALLRETAQKVPVRYDLQAGLSRYEATLAKQPPPATPSLPPVPPGPGALATVSGAKLTVGVVAAGTVLVAGFQLAPSSGEDRPTSARATAEVGGTGLALTEPGHEPVQDVSDRAPRGEHITDDIQVSPMAVAPSRPRSAATPDEDPPAAESSSVRAGRAKRVEGHRGPVGRPTPAIRSHATPRHTRSAVRPATVARTPAGSAAPPPASAAPAPPPSADPSPDPQPPATRPREEPTRVSEVEALGRAHALLRSDPAKALALVRRVARTDDAATYLTEERRYLEVMALSAMGERREARQAAEAFVQAYPRSGFRSQVEHAVDGGAR